MLDLFFGSHLLALFVTGHAAVELPAHLAVGFFESELVTLFVQVLQLNSVLVFAGPLFFLKTR